ncbi:AraC family transcriptional regulator [Actinoplanes sp. NPDC051861]|uniref:helix-turn-helix transcriptional regulator n=1 Tax=Actinoplanes sp. NPDC051861 TaxID=3155170 RepID=UPI0034197D72
MRAEAVAMDDFASGVLVAAVRRALAADGLLPPEPPPTAAAEAVGGPGPAGGGAGPAGGGVRPAGGGVRPAGGGVRPAGGDAAPVHGALVPLAEKRSLLSAVAAEHGLLPLLSVGRTLLRDSADPALAALRAATGPGDLLDRWGRLERFTHSRHRVVVHRISATGMEAEHKGPPGQPPEPPEDALILGLLTALMTATGARGLTVGLSAYASDVVFIRDAFRTPLAGPGTASWHFSWSSWVMPLRRAPSPDESPAARTRRMLSCDLARRWTLDAVAGELGVSARSLQRRLRDERGFSGLLAAVRADAAAVLLREGRHPLSVIGFTCGYADQPHFTREFKRRTAMTPGQYRAAFGEES